MERSPRRLLNRSQFFLKTMALRYRRRINILPGVHLNVSRSGISTTLGVRGASMTFGKRGRYINTGIPGTGISWRSRVGSSGSTSAVAGEPSIAPSGARHVPYHTHHLHWWKVALFFVLMIIAAASKSNAFIGLFWFGYFAYWFLLFVRLTVRKTRERMEGATNEGVAQ